MNSNKNNNNKSMFLYTALIFLVAIILIILSFFGQTNVKNNQPSSSQTQEKSTEGIGEGITQKASVLSRYNAELVNENKELNEYLTAADERINSLQEENETLKIYISNYELLINVYQYIQQQKTDDATEVLSIINYDGLTEDQKVTYDKLKNILK